MEHERGLKDIEAKSKPAAVLSVDDKEGQLGEVANHIRGQSDSLTQAMALLAQSMQLQAQATVEMKEALSRPKQIIRGKDGRAVGVA